MRAEGPVSGAARPIVTTRSPAACVNVGATARGRAVNNSGNREDVIFFINEPCDT